MYRRIELINHYGRRFHEADNEQRDYKQGLMGISPEPVVATWIYKLRGCGRSLPRNSRFYFTEKGWREIGRMVVSACRKSGQEYRVIAIKETDAQVVWRDKHTGYEVAVQPARRRA